MRAWEVAHKEGRRVFYESATDTVRACPENYCLAVRTGDSWGPHPWEGAIADIRPIIGRAIQQAALAGKPDGETLAALLALKLKLWRYNYKKSLDTQT